MADTTNPAGATPVVPGATPGQSATPTTPTTPDPPATGDPQMATDEGRRALDQLRAELKAERAAAKAAAAELEQLRLAGASETEKAIAKAKADGVAEVTSRFHDQIRRSEVKVALTALGITPSALDIAAAAPEFASLKVGEDGSIEGIDKAASAFKSARGDLFPAGRRPTGSADAGSATAAGASPTTFTRDQIADPAFFKANKDAILAASRRPGGITG